MKNQTVYLPLLMFGPLSYWQQISKAKNVVFEAQENFPRQTYRNRYEISGANGKQVLTAPVIWHHGEKVLYQNMAFNNTENWKNKHLMAIKSCYGNSPFYLYLEAELTDLFKQESKSIFDFNLLVFIFIKDLLKLNIEINLTNEFNQFPEGSINLYTDFYDKKIPKTNPNIIYYQTFEERNGFIENLSILDLILNQGSEALSVLLTED